METNIIKDFVKTNISSYNNVRILEPELKDIAEDICETIMLFVINLFKLNPIEFRYNETKIDQFPLDEEFGDKVIPFLDELYIEMENQKQSKNQIIRYGDHSKINLFIKEYFLQIVNYFKQNNKELSD